MEVKSIDDIDEQIKAALDAQVIYNGKRCTEYDNMINMLVCCDTDELQSIIFLSLAKHANILQRNPTAFEELLNLFFSFEIIEIPSKVFNSFCIFLKSLANVGTDFVSPIFLMLLENLKITSSELRLDFEKQSFIETIQITRLLQVHKAIYEIVKINPLNSKKLFVSIEGKYPKIYEKFKKHSQYIFEIIALAELVPDISDDILKLLITKINDLVPRTKPLLDGSCLFDICCSTLFIGAAKYKRMFAILKTILLENLGEFLDQVNSSENFFYFVYFLLFSQATPDVLSSKDIVSIFKKTLFENNTAKAKKSWVNRLFFLVSLTLRLKTLNVKIIKWVVQNLVAFVNDYETNNSLYLTMDIKRDDHINLVIEEHLELLCVFHSLLEILRIRKRILGNEAARIFKILEKYKTDTNKSKFNPLRYFNEYSTTENQLKVALFKKKLQNRNIPLNEAFVFSLKKVTALCLEHYVRDDTKMLVLSRQNSDVQNLEITLRAPRSQSFKYHIPTSYEFIPSQTFENGQILSSNFKSNTVYNNTFGQSLPIEDEALPNLGSLDSNASWISTPPLTSD